jgi:hypothetical protein
MTMMTPQKLAAAAACDRLIDNMSNVSLSTTSSGISESSLIEEKKSAEDADLKGKFHEESIMDKRLLNTKRPVWKEMVSNGTSSSMKMN